MRSADLARDPDDRFGRELGCLTLDSCVFGVPGLVFSAIVGVIAALAHRHRSK